MRAYSSCICADRHHAMTFEDKMEVIWDELNKSGVKIDMRVLKHYIARILDQAGIERTLDLIDIFHKMEVNNFGRVMVYLGFIYVSKSSEQDVRRAVQLVSVTLKRCVL